MLGTGARRPTVAFLGWFGPRGAASIVFALLVLEEEGLPHESAILTTAFVTVGLSVLAHGDRPPRRSRRATPTGTTRASAETPVESGEEARAPAGASARGGDHEDRLDGGGAPDRRARAAPRRLGDERPRHRPQARLPPDRPDLDGRAAAAARPLEPARAVRRRRARPPALGRARSSSSGTRSSGRSRISRSLRARMRRRRAEPHCSRERMGRRVPAASTRAFKRYVLRELERERPDALARAASTRPRRDATRSTAGGAARERAAHARDPPRARRRRRRRAPGGNQRLWDLAERWYPEAETVSLRDAERAFAEKRFRALGVRLTRHGLGGASRGRRDGPVPDRVTFLSPFDRLIHDRDRAEALFDFHYRLEMYVPKAKREYGYYVLPILVGDRLVGRIEPRFDRKTGDARGARRLGRHLSRGRGAREPARLARRERRVSSIRPCSSRRARSTRGRSRTPRRARSRPRSTRRRRTSRTPSASTRATTTRGSGTRRGRRCRSASRRSRAPRTAVRSRPGSARRRPSCTCSRRATTSSP